MLVREVEVGTFYKYFKGHIYKVICIAKDSESLEEKVVYMNNDSKEIWIRDKINFLSEVDHKKYPDIRQKYRFERIEYCEVE